ncbi:MAG: hypothetical protein ACREFQ_02545, partial [Stellaceae bacterium]
WDIVKFGTVGFIVLAIGAGMAMSDLAVWANRFRRRLIYIVLVVAVVSQGIVYPYPLTLASYNPSGRRPFSTQIIRPYFSRAYPVDNDDARAVNYLRRHMRPSDIVYRAKAKSEPYAIWGGLPTQLSVYAPERTDDAYGLGAKKLAARRDLNRISPDWFDRLAAQRVTWLVTDPSDRAIDALVKSPEARQRAILVAQYGDVRVFRLERPVPMAPAPIASHRDEFAKIFMKR